MAEADPTIARMALNRGAGWELVAMHTGSGVAFSLRNERTGESVPVERDLAETLLAMRDLKQAQPQQTKQEKTETPPAAPEPLVSGVRKWLDTQGYPLEMRVARMFQKEFASTRPSNFYETKEGKGREIDICARWGKEWLFKDSLGAERFLWFDLFVVCECKSGPKSNKPWIVFSAPLAALGGIARFKRLATPIAADAIAMMAEQDGAFRGLELFFVGQRVGYSMATMNLNKDDGGYDQAYGAVTSLVSAAVAKSDLKTIQAGSLPKYTHIAWVAFPVLAVSTPLLECWLAPNGEITLEERDEMLLYWQDHTLTGGMDSFVHVVRESAMPRFVARARAAFEHMSKQTFTIETAANASP